MPNTGLSFDMYNSVVLTEDGEYRIVLIDLAKNATEFVFTIDTGQPEVAFVGVEHGGKTGGNIALKNLEQVSVAAYLNGQAFEYVLGSELTKEGSYRMVLTDSADNH